MAPSETTAPIHSFDTGQVTRLLETDSADGLSRDEAAARLERDGPNILPQPAGDTPLKLFLRQFSSVLVIILLGAAALSFAVWLLESEQALPYDTIVILAIVLANAVLGFYQEYKAEQSLERLTALSGPEAMVVRDGVRERIPAAELVKGDLVVISTGDKISADARLVEATSIEADESALTGESEPVAKSTEAVAEKAALGDRAGMVFSGTMITYGHGLAVVSATGSETEVGKIAGLLGAAPRKDTPLQQNLDKLGKWLGIIVLVIAAVVAVTGFALSGEFNLDSALEMLLFGVALAVAAIPEGLPAVVTAALALGTQRMARRQAIVRKLPAVETLGSTTAICSDKTGTLTMGEMTVRELYLASGNLTIDGAGYSPEGTVTGPDAAKSAAASMARAAVLCNDSGIYETEEGKWQALGSPTEAALVSMAVKLGVDYEELRGLNPRVAEAQFSSERKKMSVVVSDRDERILHTKGAPEMVIPLCSHILGADGIVPLDDEARGELYDEAARMAGKALRTLALATRKLTEECEYVADCEHDLIFLGMVGIADPPRPEARDAISECYGAGIEVYMLTGDHLVTARAIAAELGIKGDAMTGAEIDGTEDERLVETIAGIRIFARVSPRHKVRIVNTLQGEGHTVAVTGDGVNDAPALKHADIGVAMGITGTDVSREAADMVLANDNFATIVAAVEEGRSIFSNIRRFVTFLLATNSGEILTLFIGVILAGMLGLRADGQLLLPLLAVQILWINLVTDGLPALALGIEPKHPEAMNRPPRPRDEQVMNSIVWQRIGVIGVISCVATLLMLDAYLDGGLLTPFGGHDITYARTTAFATLAFFQMFDALNCRFLKESSLPRPFGNRWLLGALAVSLLMMVTVIQIPFLQRAFHTTGLALRDWGMAFLVGSLALWSIELLKLYNRRRSGGGVGR